MIETTTTIKWLRRFLFLGALTGMGLTFYSMTLLGVHTGEIHLVYLAVAGLVVTLVCLGLMEYIDKHEWWVP